MKAEELIKLGNDIDQLLSSRSLPNKPIFDIVVPYDEFVGFVQYFVAHLGKDAT